MQKQLNEINIKLMKFNENLSIKHERIIDNASANTTNANWTKGNDIVMKEF